MNHFEIRLPIPISDETAYALHTLLNQLAYEFERSYFTRIHRHNQWLQQAETPDQPWDQPISDELPF